MKNMGEFDPFSGGSNFNSYESKPKSKPNNLQPVIIKGIIIFIVLSVVGFGIYYLFFNTAEVFFEIKDTEGKSVDAQIKIGKLGSNKEDTYSTDDSIILNKSGKYTYRIYPKDDEFNGIIKKTEFTTDDETIEVKLTKKIKFTVSKITCPQKVFLGQKITCQIDVENKSPSQDYNVSSFVFSGDVSNWDDFKNKTYKFVDSFGEELSTARKTVLPATNTVFLLSFNVPSDKKIIGNKKINIRIKYTDSNKNATFEIADVPVVSFTSDIGSITKLISGEEKKVNYTLDNTKNTTKISDLILDFDANYTSAFDYNLDLQNTIIRDAINLSAESKEKKTGQITIKLPSNTRAGKIEGNLILTGSIFPEPKKIPFSINVEEPENKFQLSLTKSSESLIYDANNGVTNEKIISLKVDNQNALKVKINTIGVENLMTDNCEKWISITTAYNDYEVQPKDKPEIPIVLKGTDLSGITNITGTKLCAIKVNYQNPFTGEDIDKILNLTITVG